MLLLKDSLEPSRIKSIDIWLQYQELCILINKMVLLKNTIIHLEQSKWNLWMWSLAHILTLVLKIMINILNLKLVIMWEYQNIIGLKKCLSLKKVENIVLWKYLEEIVRTFYEK